MSLQDIAALGKLLGQFLSLFADCFRRPAGRMLLAVCVRGLLSHVQRKNVEAMALAQGVAVRTLQRFLESIRWDEELLRDRCQQRVAAEHADPEALGVIDETGTTKSGGHTAGVKRQYNGNRGKIENCVNNVAISYAGDDFHCLLDARLYLPEEWANDPVRRKKTTFPTRSSFKPNRKSRSILSIVRWPMGFA
jgi:SRSO17 transposase